MSKTTCEIVFDNNANRVYYGGQTVGGSVTLTLHKEKTVKGKNELTLFTLTIESISSNCVCSFRNFQQAFTLRFRAMQNVCGASIRVTNVWRTGARSAICQRKFILLVKRMVWINW